MRKRGQAWGFDLVIASAIFIFAIIFFYFYALNYSSGEDEFRILREEGEFIAESLLSEGYPADWNQTNVIRIGILSENKLNETKLAMFYDLTKDNYAYTKNLFKIRNNYHIDFSLPINIDGESVQEIGLQNQNPQNLALITRVVPYNGAILTLEIEIWN